jgi:hypothetical protein
MRNASARARLRQRNIKQGLNVMPEQTDTNIEKYNDAVLIHSERLSEKFLAQPIQVSIGIKRYAPKWPLAEGWTVFELIKKLTVHEVGKRMGTPSCKATRRLANATVRR